MVDIDKIVRVTLRLGNTERDPRDPAASRDVWGEPVASELHAPPNIEARFLIEVFWRRHADRWIWQLSRSHTGQDVVIDWDDELVGPDEALAAGRSSLKGWLNAVSEGPPIKASEAP